MRPLVISDVLWWAGPNEGGDVVGLAKLEDAEDFG